jgi:hypothetical protein
MVDFYGTNAEGLAYMTARGRVAEWPTDETAANAKLLLVSEYIDRRYRVGFPGLKIGQRAQIREWPRSGAYDVYGDVIPLDEIPREVEWAAYELVAIIEETPDALYTNVIMGENIRQVSVDGAVSVTYAGASNVFDMQLSIPVVDAILAPIMTGLDTLNTSPLSGRTVRT